MNSPYTDMERELALLLVSAREEFGRVRLQVEEDKLILEGFVQSYELKRRAEELARKAGFESIENTLRVLPLRSRLGPDHLPALDARGLR